MSQNIFKNKMVQAKVLNVCEYYEARDDENACQSAYVVGKTVEGEVVHYVKRDIKHEFFVAVSEDYDEDSAIVLGHRLNKFLLENQGFCQIQGTPQCKCSYQRAENNEYYINNSACLQDRLTDECAVSDVEFIRGRSFTGFERYDRKFLRIILTRSYYANKQAHEFVLQELAMDDLADELRGVYELTNKFQESFVNTTEIAGGDWIDTDTGQKVDPQPSDKVKVPIRTMTFDIETLNPHGVSCDPTKHRVGCLAVLLEPLEEIHCYVLGMKKADIYNSPGWIADTQFLQDWEGGKVDKKLANRVKMIKRIRAIVASGKLVEHYFQDERSMLEAFVRASVKEFDPDFIQGYNSNDFDIPYVVERLKQNRCPWYRDWSRLGKLYPIRFRKHLMKSEQKGARWTTQVQCPGRISLDLMRAAFDDGQLKLNNLKLNTVGKFYGLGGKVEMPPENIFPSWAGSEIQRGDLVYYNIVDTVLTAEIAKTRLSVDNCLIAARMTRMFPEEILERGISYAENRVVTATTYKERYFKPTLLKDPITKQKILPLVITQHAEEMKYRETGINGGKVIDPIPVHSELPIAVLDFNSLYPSIMRAFNICHTTWVRDMNDLHRQGLTLEDVHETPCGAMFVKRHIRHGILPRIVEDFVNRRDEIREKEQKAIDKSVDMIAWLVLECIQLLMKLYANSAFGQTSMKASPLCLMMAGQSITSYGQKLITQVGDYCVNSERLKKFGIKLIYGDTDSVMITLGTADVDEARRRFKETSRAINTESGIMVHPLFLGEDGFFIEGYFLGPKRYLVATCSANPGAPVERKIKLKGIQFVKRDSCDFVREIGYQFLDNILIHRRSKDECFYFLMDCFERIFANQIPPEKLVLSAKMSKPLEEYERNADGKYTERHTVAAEQLLKKNIVIYPGDRVRYILCDIPKATKQADRVIAEEIFDPKIHRPHYQSYAEYLASPFELITELAFGRVNSKALLDLTRYTQRSTQFFRQLGLEKLRYIEFSKETAQAEYELRGAEMKEEERKEKEKLEKKAKEAAMTPEEKEKLEKEKKATKGKKRAKISDTGVDLRTIFSQKIKPKPVEQEEEDVKPTTDDQ